MNQADRLHQALSLYAYEPPATRRGENAGTRSHEGVNFRNLMVPLLAAPGYTIETAVGKSSKGKRVDGNAVERVAYKMLRFKRDPLMHGKTLVVAFNVAFRKYDSQSASELAIQAAYLNGLDSRAPIVLLVRRQDYETYIKAVFP